MPAPKKTATKKHDSRRKNTVDVKNLRYFVSLQRDIKTSGTKWVEIDMLRGCDRCLSYILMLYINVSFDNLSAITS